MWVPAFVVRSFNVFMPDPTPAKLTSMHFYGWKSGLKTGMYYLRTRPAADAIKFTLDPAPLTKSAASSSSPLSAVAVAEPCVDAKPLPESQGPDGDKENVLSTEPLPVESTEKKTTQSLAERLREFEAAYQDGPACLSCGS